MTIGRLLQDWAVPAALAAVAVAETLGNEGLRPVLGPALGLPLILAAVAALGLRRTRPATVAALVSLLSAGFVLAAQRDLSTQPPITPFLVLLVAYFSLGAQARPRHFLRGALLSAALMGTVEVSMLVAGRSPGEVLPSLLFWGTAMVLGRLLYYRGRETAAERERAARAEQDRDRLAREAATEERSRIARELHDVVAHSLSVMVIQASVEARLLGDRDDATARTLRTIETTGREALVELRRLLGLLRVDGEAGTALEPPPSLRQLEDLLGTVRRAGVAADLVVTGEPRALPAGVDLSAYRVAQEALTNALKHAPGSAVRVHVDYTGEAVTVAVDNDPPVGVAGTGDGLAGTGGGHGLVGMYERVRLYGGDLQVGPRPGGGFGVRARIPAPAALPEGAL